MTVNRGVARGPYGRSSAVIRGNPQVYEPTASNCLQRNVAQRVLTIDRSSIIHDNIRGVGHKRVR